ncbi:MAG: transposase [Ignavibacteriales bacterium]|nr:transposase [Ignavibacteriales bacterium]
MARTQYKIYHADLPHFVTCTVVNWLPIFSHPYLAQVLLDSLTFLQNEKRLCVYGYVILENHLHLIASSPDLSKELGDFKSFTAVTIVRLLNERHMRSLLDELRRHKLAHKTDREHQVWQEGSHPQEIISETMFRQKLNYIHNNPVRRGYVSDPLHWRYSSAENYAGGKGLIDVNTEW